jgi:Kef-type K+ transport system membrane component KefB
MIARWMGDSSILPVRISILILLGLISLANKLGMEMVLGAYTAGMMIAMLTKVEILQYRLTSIGSGPRRGRGCAPAFLMDTGKRRLSSPF